MQQKASALLRQELATLKIYQSAKEKAAVARAHVVLTPGGGGIQYMQDDYKDRLHLLTWIAALVLLVACANVANLMLVRGMGRRAEMSIRAALGARRGRIVRQLLTESVLLAGLGAVLGLGVSYLGARMLLALAFPGEQHVPIDPAPSAMVIAFACGLALITGILFGVAPAYIASRAQPADALRSKVRTTTHGASLLQRGLVVLQAALSLVLLVGAGLFAQSLNKLQSTNLKLDATNRYIIRINPQSAGYATTQVEALYRTIEDRFHQLPGVVKVGLATYTPMEDNNWSTGIKVEGEPDINKESSFVKATSEYFDSVGTHVVMGRGFTPLDTLSAPPVAVVNEEFAKQFFGNRNPVGHRFGSTDVGKDSAYEIVGVVDDTTYTSIYWKNHAMYFVPLTQRPAHSDEPVEKDISLYAGAIVVQTGQPIPDMEKLALATLTAINPNLTIVKFQTFQQQINDQFTDERMIARLTSLFGGLALLLAAIGLYGVTAYTVVRRTPEIGVRMALGARRGRVIAMVMRGAVVQALIGLVIGVPIVVLCDALYQVAALRDHQRESSCDGGRYRRPCVASAIAGIIPARRAASIDPVRALRIE